MTRSERVDVRDKIIFIDELGNIHPATVTYLWGEPDAYPTLNLRVDGAEADRTSVQHRSRTDAPGFYWILR